MCWCLCSVVIFSKMLGKMCANTSVNWEQESGSELYRGVVGTSPVQLLCLRHPLRTPWAPGQCLEHRGASITGMQLQRYLEPQSFLPHASAVRPRWSFLEGRPLHIRHVCVCPVAILCGLRARIPEPDHLGSRLGFTTCLSRSLGKVLYHSAPVTFSEWCRQWQSRFRGLLWELNDNIFKALRMGPGRE